MSAKKGGPSSKLMSMKFMMNAADKEAAKVAEAAQVKVISDSHWKLSFKDKSRNAEASEAQVIYAPSYTSFIETETGGRRSFGKKAEEKQEDVKDSDDALGESDDETPEDAFARRQAEKETDRDTLRSMHGASSLSGAAKRKPAKSDESIKKKRKK
ncbi:hypothetical protein BCR37DRAFT_392442 [Protomyces lactucae-debilis]|uniref:Uncharacterized protein n=1 Tax=Protomyces lactucae-debilis TaxID=2754530 RepID=A0A1Y2FGM9_PROLT|nr:uncharacterized protein BCR37DRAFT_392442 [Protomyces lactucae-debilis]ORY83082.1 hypothetical protein BCR37DRAFT_392442 [Protomyces lactucae-debilis]